MRLVALQALVVLITVVVANGQCVARCIAEPCHGAQSPSERRDGTNNSPCHRKDQPANSTPPQPCQFSVVADHRAPAPATTEIVPPNHALDVIADVPATVTVEVRRSLPNDSSPPATTDFAFSTVRR